MLGFVKSDVRLAFNFFAMNVRDRYMGSSLGSFWAIANPVFMLGLYTFVFGFVFKQRLPGASTTLTYVIWLISGYGPWIATLEGLTAATGSVVGASGLVKNLAFKTELLPIAAIFVGLFSLGVSLVFLFALIFAAGSRPDWHVIWLPLIIAMQFFLIIAIGIWLAAFNVFVRDLSLALPNLLTIIMFATPIFYPITSLPRVMQIISKANPFYIISDSYRTILVSNGSPDGVLIAYLFILSAIIFIGGLFTFRRLKFYFDSVL